MLIFFLEGLFLQIKVNFKGEQLCHFHLCLPSNGSTLKGKINRIYDGVEARQGNLRLVFRLFKSYAGQASLAEHKT